MPVRLTVSAEVARRLVPTRKAMGEFLTGKIRLLDLALLCSRALYWHPREPGSIRYARDLALLNSSPQPLVAALAARDKVGAVTAADYADVATKNLFSKDRNPNVIVDCLRLR